MRRIALRPSKKLEYSNIPRTLFSERRFVPRSRKTRRCDARAINRIYFNYSRADDDICYVMRAHESLEGYFTKGVDKVRKVRGK